jgi:hypothetical protein
MSGLELCPKCKTGHLYPVVTTRLSTEPKDQFRETGLEIINAIFAVIIKKEQNRRKFWT